MPFSESEAFTLSAMTEEAAREIVRWRYTGDYALYNMDSRHVDDAVKSFLEPRYAYHAAWRRDHGLAGFCCYGQDAQVPGGDYAAPAIDVGLGMRPDLVGQGLGDEFLRSILAHRAGEAAPFRATIATFNARSRRLFEKAGFAVEQTFTVQAPRVDGGTLNFVVMVKQPSQFVADNDEPEDVR